MDTTTDDVDWGTDASKTSSTRGKKKKSEWADDDFDSADVDMKTAKDDAKLKRPPAKKGKKGKATEWGDDEDTDAGWGDVTADTGDDGWDMKDEKDEEEEPDGDGDDEDGPALARSNSFTILSSAKLEDKEQALIKQMAEVLYVDPTEAGILLRHYGWKEEKLKKEWFAGQEKVRQDVGLCPAPDAKASPKMVQCDSAFCDSVPVEKAARLNCGHWFCNDCWEGYLVSQINAGATAIFTRCPGMRCKLNHNHKFGCACNEKVPEAYFERFVKDKELLAKYKRWMLNSFVEGQKNIKWCPKPGCDFAVAYPQGGTRAITCKCGHRFCFSCLEENKACNHMNCAKCGHHFCWLCKGPWDKHGSETGGFYVCNKYNEQKEKGSVSEEEAKMITNTKLLQKYTYYYKRFKGSADSIKMTRTLGKKIEADFADQELNKYSFLLEAVEKLVSARQVLQWTYCMAFYLASNPKKPESKDKDKVTAGSGSGSGSASAAKTAPKAAPHHAGPPKPSESKRESGPEGKASKQLFEYQQGMLLESTEQLQDIMESNSTEKLMDLRKDILNKSASIDKFRAEMVKQVERGDFEELLLTKEDSESEMWGCSTCSKQNKKEDPLCTACTACRLHGEMDCKACKKPEKPGGR